MLIISYIIFWGILPIFCIFYRFKKRISIGFAFAGIFTSFTLGIIFIGTFQVKPADRIVQFLNENRPEEAKKELQLILQRDPEDVRKIETDMIDTPVMYERIKKELEEEYLRISRGIIKEHGVYNEAGCNALDANKVNRTELEHAFRLLEMAESIGEDERSAKERVRQKIIRFDKAIKQQEKGCQ